MKLFLSFLTDVVVVPVLFNRCSSCSCHVYLLATPNKTYSNIIRNIT